VLQLLNMAQFFQQPPNQPYGASGQNLQFYPSSYTPGPVSGHATPQQASYGYGAPAGSPGYGAQGGFNSGFGAPTGVSGRMGEQGGLRTGWLAAFGTEGYDGEPPLLEELGVNFGHIQSKVFSLSYSCQENRGLMIQIDISSPQSPRTNRPTYNGRFRPRRPNSFLPSLWHLPPPFWKSPLRIYLRSRTFRHHLSTLDPCTHVPSP
jgi:hypothetical protein